MHIRDETLAELGESAPPFTVTEVLERPEPGIARQITGTFTVTNWLTGNGGPGERFHYDSRTPAPGEMPTPNGTVEAPFRCDVTERVLAARGDAHFVQYGHGLLGSEDEVGAGNLGDFADEHLVVFCATKWAGMSEDDIGNAVASLQDLSNFPTLVDRLQQGLLNQLVLSRLMLAADGLSSDPALARPDGTPIVDASTIDYDGNSQGAIMGLALAGISPDIERFVLGVAGMNYSTLLSRSVDFDTYETIFEPAYPDPFERTLLIAMIQMLWDRGEGAGFVQHVTSDPLPGTAAKDVLVHVAFGDWQVSELTAFVEARTMGLPVHRPVTADGRSGEVEPGWGLDPIDYPSNGGGLLVWDSGSDPIPFENLAPRTSRDPHEDPRADADVRRQKAAFLFEDRLIDVCDASACTADRVD